MKYLVNSTVGKATEMTSEACGYHSQLATEEGLTSKPLFILLTNCGQAAKVSVGEKLFTDLFSVFPFTEECCPENSNKKRAFFPSVSFSSLGRNSQSLQQFLENKMDLSSFLFSASDASVSLFSAA